MVRGGNWIKTGRTLFVCCAGPAVDGLITLAFLDWDSSADSALRFKTLVVEAILFGGILRNKAGLQILWGWKNNIGRLNILSNSP